MKRLVLGIAVVLVAVGASWFTFTGQLQMSRATDAVRSAMKDPESVKFSGLRYLRASGAVCGNFNAKNSFGAYVGAKQFVRTADGHVYLQPQQKPQVDDSELEYLDKHDPFKAYQKRQELLKEFDAQKMALQKIINVCEVSS